MGESPPHKTIVALSKLLTAPIGRTDAEKVYGRNPVQALAKLGLFDAHGDLCIAGEIKGADPRQIVLAAAEANEVLKYVAGLMEESSKISGRWVGDQIADKFDSEWSDASKQRIGGALYQWVWWIRRQHQGKDIMDAAAIVEAVRSMPSDSKEEIPLSLLYADDESTANRGRPTKLGPEVLRAIEELRYVYGMNITLLAQRFGVSRATIHRGLKRSKGLP